MSPKEKAKELVNKFQKQIFFAVSDERLDIEEAKGCALIAIDEIIESAPRYPNDVDWDDVGATHQYYYEAQHEESLNFWKQVKQEIEKL